MNLYVIDGFGSYSAGCCVVAATSPGMATKTVLDYIREINSGDEPTFDIDYTDPPKLIAENVSGYQKAEVLHILEFGE